MAGQGRKTLTRYAACLAGFLCACPSAVADRVEETAYSYPYANPYLATTTVAILKDRDHEWADDKNQYLRLELMAGRGAVPLLEGKGELRVRYTPQAGPAPLVFLIPGFGGSAYTGATRYVAELFSDHGYHVLALPSPFNWNFTLSASRTGFPGLTGQDSKDLYLAMQATLAYVRAHFHPEITGFGLIGLSHGALYAANVGRLDAEQKKIGLGRILLVNPPIDLLRAIHTIDQLADLGNRYTEKARDDIEAYATGVAWQASRRNIDDPDYFADWDQRLKLNEREIRYLIGKALRQPVGDALYAISLAQPLQILDEPISWGYRSARLEQARSFSLADYLNKVLVPQMEFTSGRDLRLERLVTEASFKSIAPALQGNPKVFFMHNADDFLISQDDLKLAEKTFGRRATIYPRGGHLGNLWNPINRHDILSVFELLRHVGNGPRSSAAE